MAKVTVHRNGRPPVETPSEAIVNAANEVHTAVDGQGRAIGIKKLSPVERLRMLKLIGGQNPHYMGMASLAFLVVSIDDQPVSKPVNELALEGLISRLGDDGIEAVSAKAAEVFGVSEDDDRDAIKNS